MNRPTHLELLIENNRNFLDVIEQSPSREWIEEYLDLVKDLIEFTEIESQDPRLVLSIRDNSRMPVTINQRWVLVAKPSTAMVGFIFTSDFEELSSLKYRADKCDKYKPYKQETPYFLEFKGFPNHILTPTQKAAWKKAVFSELNRGSTSSYKKYHRFAIYEAAVNLEYRALVLEKGLQQTKIKKIDLEPEFYTQRQRMEQEGYFNVETIKDARQKIMTSIVQRQGQSEFRRKLLTAYNSQCAVTGCDVEPALEAAHILSYQGTQTNHVTNGLILRADIHTLFDLHLLSVRPDTYKIVIAPELIKTCYQEFEGHQLTLPKDEFLFPSKDALRKHYQIFLEKHKN